MTKKKRRYNAEDKFSQPGDAVIVVSEAPGPHWHLPQEVLDSAKLRVQMGADAAAIAHELAIRELALQAQLGILDDEDDA
jgi:hypothetical protein